MLKYAKREAELYHGTQANYSMTVTVGPDVRDIDIKRRILHSPTTEEGVIGTRSTVWALSRSVSVPFTWTDSIL